VTEPVFTDVLQVAVVVRDLEAAMRRYWEGYGIGPWQIYEFIPGTVQDMTRDGQPAEFSLRLALARLGGVMVELIEPLDDESIYAEFLRARGEGVHHIGLAASEYATARAALEARAHPSITGDVYNGVTFSYHDTEQELGFVSEIFDWPPGLVQEPDAVYPPEAES
jgi:Glyoxalase/Bleomycin resistance protein/Dioxygenase superfamily